MGDQKGIIELGQVEDHMQASGKKVKIEVKVGNAEEGETAHLAANSSRDELGLLRKEQAQGGAKKVTESNSF